MAYLESDPNEMLDGNTSEGAAAKCSSFTGWPGRPISICAGQVFNSRVALRVYLVQSGLAGGWLFTTVMLTGAEVARMPAVSVATAVRL
jgi:hypothetical protein